jgi:hypothetical protein
VGRKRQDTLKRKPDRSSERVGERRLADSGDIFDEQMTAREQARERKSYLQLLSEDDAADLLDDLIDAGAHFLSPVVCHSAVEESHT